MSRTRLRSPAPHQDLSPVPSTNQVHNPFLSSSSENSSIFPDSIRLYTPTSYDTPPSAILNQFPNPPDFTLFPELTPSSLSSPPLVVQNLPPVEPQTPLEICPLSVNLELTPDRRHAFLTSRNLSKIRARMVHILNSFQVTF